MGNRGGDAAGPPGFPPHEAIMEASARFSRSAGDAIRGFSKATQDRLSRAAGDLHGLVTSMRAFPFGISADRADLDSRNECTSRNSTPFLLPALVQGVLPFARVSGMRREASSIIRNPIADIAGAAPSSAGSPGVSSSPASAGSPSQPEARPDPTASSAPANSSNPPAGIPPPAPGPHPAASGSASGEGSGGAGTGSGPAEASSDERILISEVDVTGVDGELREKARRSLQTRPNFAYTLSELQQDVQRVYDLGYFQSCSAKPEDTRDGVRITFVVVANPELKGIALNGANALPQRVVEDAFRDHYGKTVNFHRFSDAVSKLQRWYEERGYFGQIVDMEMQGNVAELKVTEAVVSDVKVRFLSGDTGKPAKGKTKESVVLRQMGTQPGRNYSVAQARSDIESLYATGLFEDVTMNPSTEDPPGATTQRVNITVNIVERKAGGLSAGGGLSALAAGEGQSPGFIGNIAYSQRNLFGLNQKLTASVEMGQSDALFRLSHLDPWVRGDTNRTSRNVQLQNTRASAASILGAARQDEEEVPGAMEESLTLGRMQALTEWSRPLSESWSAGLACSAQRIQCLKDGRPVTKDQYQAPVTWSGESSDLCASVRGQVVFSPKQGDAHLAVTAEKAFPMPGPAAGLLGDNWLSFVRMRVRAEREIPVGPITVVAHGKGGAIWGDLPPYEAFAIGGTNSVRGYEEGGVGTGRKCMVGTIEARVPLVSAVSGVAFVDYGTDCGTGETVSGDPAGTRGKPGAGYGVGAGLRLDSPVGPLRLEYAFNDRGRGRFHFGVGAQV